MFTIEIIDVVKTLTIISNNPVQLAHDSWAANKKSIFHDIIRSIHGN
jgi:hypothetical protein